MMTHCVRQGIIWLSLLLLLIGLAGCGEPIDAESEIVGVGGSRPELVTASFFDDFNLALQDPTITQTDVRRTWAERLASYFAPSERIDQRGVIEQTLSNFAYGLTQLEDNERLEIEITYANVELVEQNDNLASVRLIDGQIHLRRLQEIEEGEERVVFEQERPLADVIGQEGNEFPVLRVSGRWFMTER